MPELLEPCHGSVGDRGGEGGEEGARGQSRPRIAAGLTTDENAGLEPEHRLTVDANPNAGGSGHLPQAPREPALRRVVQRSHPQLDGRPRGLDKRDSRAGERVSRIRDDVGIEPYEPVGGNAGEHRGTLDRSRPDLDHYVAGAKTGGREDRSALRETEHLADHDGLTDRRRHLRVTTDEGDADLRGRRPEHAEHPAHRGFPRFRRKEDDREEPAWLHAADRDVVGIHEHGQSGGLVSREGDRVGGDDECPVRDVDGAGVLADARSEPHFRRQRRQLSEQLGQQLGRKLPAFEDPVVTMRTAHGGPQTTGSYPGCVFRIVLVAPAVLLIVLIAAAAPVPAGKSPLAGKTIAVDPGHNGRDWAHPEEVNKLVNAGTLWKPCDATGTATANGYSEPAFTFDVAQRLKRLLQGAGARVVLTRTSNTGWGPCITERAAIGNRAHAAAAISIHADGGPASGRGFHVIYPPSIKGLTDDIATPSRCYALQMRSAYRAGTGLPYATYLGGTGLSARSDLGGLNLSNVPKVFVETGNMRNATDARLLESPAFRERIAHGLAAGISRFLAQC